MLEVANEFSRDVENTACFRSLRRTHHAGDTILTHCNAGALATGDRTASSYPGRPRTGKKKKHRHRTRPYCRVPD